MSPPETPTPSPPPGDDVRSTDYETDVTDSTAHAVSTSFDAATGERMKRMLKIAGVVFLGAFVGVRGLRFFNDYSLARSTERALAEPRVVDVTEAKAVGAAQSLTLPGQTAAWHTATIYGRVNGFVGRWMADIGDKVHQGQVLATIETPELDAELLAARAQLQASRAQVLARASETELARTTQERWHDSPPGVVSEQEREEKRADFEGAQARMKAAEAQVALDQARVDQYTALTQFKQVVAPFAGVITERHIDIGNLVTAGSTSATTPLYQMTENNPIRVYVEVPQDLASELMRPSLPVDVLSGSGERVRVASAVARAAGAVNAQARTLRVEIDLANERQQLLPGMYVKVAFSLAPKGLAQVPPAALIFRSDGPQVALVDATGKVAFRKVTIARDDGSSIELGSGVAAGDRLVLNISSQIHEGDEVHVSADTPSAMR
jgi:RND family efflux transporter MFP subunit